MIELAAGLLLGIGLGWFQWGQKRQKPLRVVRYDYSPPVAIEPAADVERWELYLAAFAFQCALGNVTSERGVVDAGIVAGPVEYRVYAALLRRYGVWHCRGRRFSTRWLDRRPMAGVGRLRDAMKRGRVVPRWPSPTPPVVRAVYDDNHAPRIAD